MPARLVPQLLRGDLVDVLYQHTADRAEYRFGKRIASLDESADSVEVTFTDGVTLSVDLVVGADGPHSTVRRLVFGPEERFVRPLGGCHAWFTAPDSVGFDGWLLMYQAPRLHASMRPSHDPALSKAALAFRSEPIAYDRGNLDEQRALLADRFSGAGWQCDTLLQAASYAEDFYFDAFAQVNMQTFSQGRVTLLATPATALARYEAVMRPYIDRCQDLPNGIDGYLPTSAKNIAITAGVMKWMQRWPFRDFAEKKWFTTADAIDLPDYLLPNR